MSLIGVHVCVCARAHARVCVLPASTFCISLVILLSYCCLRECRRLLLLAADTTSPLDVVT